MFSVDKSHTDKQWTKVLDKVRDQVSYANFKGWFTPLSAEISGTELTIYAPSGFVKETVSTRYLALLEPAIKEIYGEDKTFTIKVDPSKHLHKVIEESDPEEEVFTPDTPSPVTFGLNPKYTLGNFVVGLSNNLAYAAAQAVTQNPGTSYNPLFIYGGTGVGKTHLMQAVGNALLQKRSNVKIIYCSSERFMNDLVQSIQTKRTGEFRSKYRACDLLLIDDVQFISGRDSTQEEFFHTFNELQAKNSQIILTSDRPPQEIQKLEPRLQSRFQGGLMVDIQDPDFDTRVAILKAKCSERGELVSESILTLIAENMPTNARELEGKFIQIVQSAKLLNQPLTEEGVRNFLGAPRTTVGNGQKIDYKKVLGEINRYFNIKIADLTGPRRKKELVTPRQIAMYLLYEECKIPYERIGELLGGRDHTTIMHGVDKINQAQNRDREIQRMLIELKQALQQ